MKSALDPYGDDRVWSVRGGARGADSRVLRTHIEVLQMAELHYAGGGGALRGELQGDAI